MIIRELLTKLGFETDTKPLEKLEGMVEGIRNRLELLAAAEVVKKLFEVSERFAEWGHNLAIMAGNIGITTTELQKLTFAAEKGGVSAEEMTHSLAHLSRHLYDAKNGSAEAAATFRKVGFTTEQVQGFKTSEDALFALADKLQSMPDPIQRMATAQELLGRGGFRLVSLLSQGSAEMRKQGEEAKRLGLVLSEGQVQALEKVAESFHKFFALLHAIGAQIAAYIAPVFSLMVDHFIALYAANKNLIGLNFETWLDGVAYGLGVLTAVVEIVVGKIVEFAKAFHVEGDLLKFVFRISGIVTGIFLFIKAMQIGGGILGVFAKGFGPVMTVLRVLFGLFTMLASPIITVGSALFGFLSPVLAVATGIAGLIFVGHELYALFSGTPTWTKQFYDWVTQLDSVKSSMKFIGGLWDRLTDALSSAVDWAKSFETVRIAVTKVQSAFDAFVTAWGTLKNGAASGWEWIKTVGSYFGEWLTSLEPVKKAMEYIVGLGTRIKGAFGEVRKALLGEEDHVTGVPEGVSEIPMTVQGAAERYESLNKKPANLGGGAGAGLSPILGAITPQMLSQVSMNVEINVPAGTDPHAVERAVATGVREHLDRAHREAQRDVEEPEDY